MPKVLATAGTLVLLLLAAGCGGDDGDPEVSAADPPSAAPPAPERLADAECPTDDTVPLGSSSREEIRLAKRGSFDVYGSERTRLAVPVDWSQDPLDAHRYRQSLHKLRFLRPLAAGYLAGDDQALRRALALTLDWVRSNPRSDPATAEVWVDKVTGDRVPQLLFVALAAACEEMLDPRAERSLTEALREHGRALASPERYVPDNHGLFVDTGLALLASRAPFLDEADHWRRLARRRFERTLRAGLSEGVWLEHSSRYQLLVIDAVEKFLHAARGDEEIERLLAERMVPAAAWLAMPDGKMTQFGDSYLYDAPAPVRDVASGQDGARLFAGAGVAVVRTKSAAGPGYLATTAGYHGPAHKHADELGFELYDRGRRVVVDTGLYHKDPSPERDFVLSAEAHSVLTTGSEGFEPSGEPYGGAIDAAGEGEGWYAISGHNPLLAAQQGVRHERLFLYRPGEALIVVDRLGGDLPGAIERRVQLAPGIGARVRQGRIELRSGELRGAITDSADSDVSIARGSREPLAGLTSPDFRVWRERPAVTLSSEPAPGVLAFTVVLEPRGRSAAAASWKAGTASIELTDGTALEVTRSGVRLHLEASE